MRLIFLLICLFTAPLAGAAMPAPATDGHCLLSDTQPQTQASDEQSCCAEQQAHCHSCSAAQAAVTALQLTGIEAAAAHPLPTAAAVHSRSSAPPLPPPIATRRA
jgi:hypothetical protein